MFGITTAAIWGVLAAIGALIVGAFGVFARNSGVNSQKAVDAKAQADLERRMRDAQASAPRTDADLDDQLRSGHF